MSRKTPAIAAGNARSACEAEMAAYRTRLLTDAVAREDMHAQSLPARQQKARAELETDVACLADLPPDERCQATLLACENNLFAQLTSEYDIIGAAYPKGGVFEYQEALFSEPISVWQFGRICAVHGSSKEEPWSRHKKAMIVLRNAAKEVAVESTDYSRVTAIFDGGQWQQFALVNDCEIHPIDSNGLAASIIIFPEAALRWFGKTALRRSLLPGFCTAVEPSRAKFAEALAGPQLPDTIDALRILFQAKPRNRTQTQQRVEAHLGRKVSLSTIDRALEEIWPKASRQTSSSFA